MVLPDFTLVCPVFIVFLDVVVLVSVGLGPES